MEKQVAYSLLEVKAFDERSGVIEGVATTPSADRVRDVMNPFGMVQRTKDIKLHLYHNTEKPVGTVEFGRPTKDGIPFRAMLPEVVEQGEVKERVDEARHSIKYKLISAVSIGFMSIPGEYELLPDGGVKYNKWEIVELSLTSVPANPEAVIRIAKSVQAGNSSVAKSLREAWKPTAVRLLKSIDHKPGAVRLLKHAP